MSYFRGDFGYREGMEKVHDWLQWQCIECGVSVFRRAQLKSSNCNGVGSFQWSTGRKKKHVKADESKIGQNRKDVVECCFGRFDLQNDALLGTDPRGQKRVAEGELTRVGLRLCTTRGRVRKSMDVLHREGPELVRVRANEASPHDRDVHVAMVWYA